MLLERAAKCCSGFPASSSTPRSTGDLTAREQQIQASAAANQTMESEARVSAAPPAAADSTPPTFQFCASDNAASSTEAPAASFAFGAGSFESGAGAAPGAAAAAEDEGALLEG